MRVFMRVGAALGTLGTLGLLVAGTALAGNFGEVTFIDGADGPPSAGEEREIRFSLLQHGVAPIQDGRVELTVTNRQTHERLTVVATHERDGIWVARVTFPAEGAWDFRVSHQWFETSQSVTRTVGPAEGTAWLPAALAIAGFAAAALVILGGMLRLRGRPAPAGEPIRAGG
jgi:hypothetical protein